MSLVKSTNTKKTKKKQKEVRDSWTPTGDVVGQVQHLPAWAAGTLLLVIIHHSPTTTTASVRILQHARGSLRGQAAVKHCQGFYGTVFYPVQQETASRKKTEALQMQRYFLKLYYDDAFRQQWET